jgi:hypothetical protein
VAEYWQLTGRPINIWERSEITVSMIPDFIVSVARRIGVNPERIRLPRNQEEWLGLNGGINGLRNGDMSYCFPFWAGSAASGYTLINGRSDEIVTDDSAAAVWLVIRP